MNALPPGSTRSPPKNSAVPATSTGGTPSRAKSIRGANGGPISAKAAARKPGGPSNLSKSASALNDEEEQDARAEMLALVEDLQERLKEAEEASDVYRKQVEVIQARLDESHIEQGKLEDKAHEDEERLEGLMNDNRELTKQKRELESIYEAERASWMREKDEASVREEDLQQSLQRVKENMATREVRNLDVESRPGLSRTRTSIVHTSDRGSTNISQQACGAKTNRPIMRVVNSHRRYNAAILAAQTQSSSCRRTR